MKPNFSLSRREFLQASGLGLSATFLAACASQATQPTVTPTAAPKPTPTVITEPTAIVGDVIDFSLNGDWVGQFGSVTFRLHEGIYNGERIYFIRTDASDIDFAQVNGLVWVPKLEIAERAPGAAASLYLFNGGHTDQLPVASTAPTREDFSSLWEVYLVSPKDDTLYESADQLKEAESSGAIDIQIPGLFVNYPVVKWPGGELSVDDEKAEYLGGGQLLSPVDTQGMTATFKLHECFPGSRYIVTDTSAAPMAPMMKVPASPPTQSLVGEGYDATDKIWVFGNGISGSGVMGFQPAIFAHRASDPVWSPFWNHFTLIWKEGVNSRVLQSAEEINAALDAGEIELFNGTPDTHPNGFVVNCPVPVLAPNTFTG